jgi:hypothetical protein
MFNVFKDINKSIMSGSVFELFEYLPGRLAPDDLPQSIFPGKLGNIAGRARTERQALVFSRKCRQNSEKLPRTCPEKDET